MSQHISKKFNALMGAMTDLLSSNETNNPILARFCTNISALSFAAQALPTSNVHKKHARNQLCNQLLTAADAVRTHGDTLANLQGAQVLPEINEVSLNCMDIVDLGKSIANCRALANSLEVLSDALENGTTVCVNDAVEALVKHVRGWRNTRNLLNNTQGLNNTATYICDTLFSRIREVFPRWLLGQPIRVQSADGASNVTVLDLATGSHT